MFIPHRLALAPDTVRFVGDPYAMVIAAREAMARDAAELVEVAFEELPAAATLADREPARARRRSGPDAPDNTACCGQNGDAAAVAAAFAARRPGRRPRPGQQPPGALAGRAARRAGPL